MLVYGVNPVLEALRAGRVRRLKVGPRGDRRIDEAVALVKGKAGLFPELKTPEVYADRPVDFENLVAAALDTHGLRGQEVDLKSPVILQTFSEASAKKLASMKIGVPVVLLLSDGKGWDSPSRVAEWKPFVQGLGPNKSILVANPQIVGWAQTAALG